MYKEPPKGLSIGFSPSSPSLKIVRNKFADIPSVALRSPESTTSLLSQKKKEMVEMIKHRKKSQGDLAELRSSIDIAVQLKPSHPL